MANKRYDQFGAGSYDPLRILLTADPSTGELKKVALNTMLGYKIYLALITQSGAGNPTAQVMLNTLGGAPAYTRDSTGSYIVTLTGAFLANKTAPFLGSLFKLPDEGGYSSVCLRDTDNTLLLLTGTDGVGYEDSLLQSTPLLIITIP